MDWTDQMVLEFVKHYEAVPVLWDTKHPDHRNRNAMNDAWKKIKTSLSWNCGYEELKRKRFSLMAYYRTTINRIKNCQNTEEPFVSTWFAFNAMHKFLGPIYEANSSFEDGEDSNDRTIKVETSRQSEDTDYEGLDSIPGLRPGKRKCSPLPAKKADQADVEIDGDECDLFARLMAKKLRRVPVECRDSLMVKIHQLVYDTGFNFGDDAIGS